MALVAGEGDGDDDGGCGGAAGADWDVATEDDVEGGEVVALSLELGVGADDVVEELRDPRPGLLQVVLLDFENLISMLPV